VPRHGGLTFDKPACTTCMNADDCCHKTIRVLHEQPGLRSLQTCMAHARSRTPAPRRTGAGPSTAAAKTDFREQRYPSLKATCAACHGPGGGAPSFFRPTRTAATRVQRAGFDKPASLLLTRAASKARRSPRHRDHRSELAGLEGGGGGGGAAVGSGGGAAVGRWRRRRRRLRPGRGRLPGQVQAGPSAALQNGPSTTRASRARRQLLPLI